MSQNLDFKHYVPYIYLVHCHWNFQEEDMFKTYNVYLFQGEIAFLFVSGKITMMGMAGTNLVFASLKP